MITHSEAIEHIFICKDCQKVFMQFIAQLGGSSTSEQKRKASVENGRKGGRPRKQLLTKKDDE